MKMFSIYELKLEKQVFYYICTENKVNVKYYDKLELGLKYSEISCIVLQFLPHNP